MNVIESWVDAAERQMPILWEHDEDMVRDYAWQSGGWVMVLRRESVGGAFILMSEGYARDDDLMVCAYSGDDCDGHMIIHTTDVRDATWWFLNGCVAPGPGMCSCDLEYGLA